jgi:gamma-glutamyl hercynylcysteine S-oxide synthase
MAEPLAEAIEAARAVTDELFFLLKPGCEYDRPIAERHRILFYIGHLEAFDWNLLGSGKVKSELDALFAFGIDPQIGKGPRDSVADWPTPDQTRRYVAGRRALVDQVLTTSDPQRLQVALEHRLMHAETLAYMFHRLERGKLIGAGQPAVSTSTPPPFEMVRVERGIAELGCAEGFGWDNEFSAHEVEVPAFMVSRHKVTNGEYLEFVDQGAGAPAFWKQGSAGWSYRGMFADIPLPLDWPVYVSKDDAEAFARRKGKRLMSEAEYHRAASALPDMGGNVDFFRWDPMPVQAGPYDGRGLSQLASNGWEWTSTPFAPFAGFEPFPFYPGYSANFFDGQHFVLKGGSPRTARVLTRRSFRNWFRHDYRYAYSTFRLAEDA